MNDEQFRKLEKILSETIAVQLTFIMLELGAVAGALVTIFLFK